ncbi:MAG: hypothetical protein CFH40_01014 [Alphaproteobacteria bacterium MarineAlpha10_Bin3]|nr:MAG: hypothetical protein CFH40_01014 [Alphaproteobacteria bacterium MarineAlpha10_Bin3]PPR72152.1 MAG: hypothetical protein CFH09_01014 [Alphaproteobacteria bacterium MarineAlpha4_Bin1]
MPDIGALLSPSSVAVIGASTDEAILRGRIMTILTSHGYAGQIYPISRRHDSVAGLKAYTRIADVPERVDLAVLIIPAEFVPDALTQCGAAGVRAAQIITSGFAEEVSGPGGGLQEQVRKIAQKYDMAVCGPNSEGFANILASLCPTFSPAVEQPELPLQSPWRNTGRIGVVAQSGGMGFSFFDRGRPKELPFSYIVTTGNEACLNAFQFVEYMLDDAQTNIFLMFLEDIKDPARFAAVAERALRAGKPIVVTKIGHSQAGQRAAASHTAALAGAYRSYRAMFERYGVIEGRDIEEIVDIAAGFSYWGDRLPAGKRVGIVTGSGGAGGWMADTAVAAGLRVPTLDPATRALIDAHLPSYGTSQNPVDGTAGAIRTVGYSFLCETVAGSDEVDAVIAITSARQPGRFEKEFDNLSQLSARIGKPVMFCSYTMPDKEAVAVLSRAGYPLFTNMPNCAHSLARMADYRAHRERFMRAPAIAKIPRPPEAGAALAAVGDVLCEYQAKQVLTCYGLDAPGETLARDADAAVAAANAIAGPVVLKVQSPDILHKTEAGVVALGLEGAAAVRASYDELMTRAARHDPNADLHGVLVQPMAPPGHEIILGVNRDAAFGPMLIVGLGGIHVEVLGDVAFSPVPLSADDARQLLDRLRGIKLLHGVRGQPPADIDALVDLMVRVARLADDWRGKIAEIDLNPILVHDRGKGLSVVDALIIKRKEND